MLQMTCPNCKGTIRSALLADVRTVTCKNCSETVPVENLTISASGFSMHRDDLLKRVFRYQKLLLEVEKERDLLKGQEGVSKESVQGVEKFIATLREMLAGTRDKFRMFFPEEVPGTLKFGHQVQSGSLTDLSMGGACIKLDSAEHLPRLGQGISLEFSLPGVSDAFLITGGVAWVKKGKKDQQGGHGIGVIFHGLKEKTAKNLWQLISSHAALEEKEKKKGR